MIDFGTIEPSGTSQKLEETQMFRRLPLLKRPRGRNSDGIPEDIRRRVGDKISHVFRTKCSTPSWCKTREILKRRGDRELAVSQLVV